MAGEWVVGLKGRYSFPDLVTGSTQAGREFGLCQVMWATGWAHF